ncbi:TlpA disulfide reductase family protein [Streptomyces sp. NPDC057539]|uniref:TlpA disulfide reductase family protein n=1 Tax=Streptomyces sp. NPDC057539 TaxID=3346159 RepID=UPI0036A13823
MPYLIAAVVFVGLLCTLDLILTLGVIKRLREHTELISNLNGRASLGIGEEVGAFEAATVDGAPMTRELLTRETLVGFFSPSCAPCREELPKFVNHARAMPDGRNQVMAVVVGDADRAAAMVAELRPVARVVVEEHNDGPLASAFQVIAFPTVLTVADGGDGTPVITQDRVKLGPAVVAA